MLDQSGGPQIIGRFYAVSDIHGHLPQLQAALDLVDLDGDPEASLLLLGDYIDRGPHSMEVLRLVKETESSHPGRVVVLPGNHEIDFLEWLDADDEDPTWLVADEGLLTIRSFVPQEVLDAILADHEREIDAASLNAAIKRAVVAHHRDLIAWLKRLPLFYETEHAIYVHAGVDEEAGEVWRAVTPDHVFTHKYPADTGGFHKLIVAGHVATSSISGDGGHGVFHDGEAHWYIDGSVETTGVLNVLRYDVADGAFEAFTVGEAVE